MRNTIFTLDRRALMAGLGAAALGPLLPIAAHAQTRKTLTLQAKPANASFRTGQPDTPIWSLSAIPPDASLRFRRGDELQLTLGNDLPAPVVLNVYGLDGAPVAEPLAIRRPLASGSKDTFVMPLRHAGTLLCDVRLLGDGQARASSALALIVQETESVAVDHDDALLIEDWRLRPDGSAISPGSDAKDGAPSYTVNGRNTLDITARNSERLRLRFINGSQRKAIAIKIEDHDVRVMAIDSQPSEPFLARNGQLVLAPGTRIDAFIDAIRPASSISSILLHDGTEPRPIARLVYSSEPAVRAAPLPPSPPLPSNGLPAKLDLRNALRVDLTLGAANGSQADWTTPVAFVASAPAFRAKAGRTVVLALTNRAELSTVFHLHGHHFRLLDRLDDGWKPFWLDTLMIDAGQTHRIAFAAETAGRWLMESVATDWTAPRLVRSYTVE